MPVITRSSPRDCHVRFSTPPTLPLPPMVRPHRPFESSPLAQQEGKPQCHTRPPLCRLPPEMFAVKSGPRSGHRPLQPRALLRQRFHLRVLLRRQGGVSQKVHEFPRFAHPAAAAARGSHGKENLNASPTASYPCRIRRKNSPDQSFICERFVNCGLVPMGATPCTSKPDEAGTGSSQGPTLKDLQFGHLVDANNYRLRIQN
ncbi:hypothetical protein R3P38DRAFT_1406292 [Favolaschia claudopus]|uniref:Uncharacterized protein n=1 Tax=Favolaschia claudopus TaxID=2862362 RepID=A0AAW0AVP6_9AGAR